jgi:hypothetical protein
MVRRASGLGGNYLLDWHDLWVTTECDDEDEL